MNRTTVFFVKLLFLNRRFVIIFTSVLIAMAAVVLLLLPNQFKAKAVIMPPQQQSSSAALLGSLGALAGATSGLAGLKSPGELYVGMLGSNSILDPIIAKHDLKKYMDVESLTEARVKLKDKTTITSGKDGLISIEVEDTDPVKAASIANDYITFLDKLNRRIAITSAARERVFFEQKIQEAKANLAKAESDMEKFQRETGFVYVDKQFDSALQAVAEINAKIATKKYEIASLSAALADGNPMLVRARAELVQLELQLKNVNESVYDSNYTKSQIPEKIGKYYNLLRELKYQEQVYAELSKQLEVSRLQEAKDFSLVQVLDKAQVPDKKSGPMRAVFLVISSVMIFLTALVIVILRDIASVNLRKIRVEINQ